jgi:hypothetical protein
MVFESWLRDPALSQNASMTRRALNGTKVLPENKTTGTLGLIAFTAKARASPFIPGIS